MLSDQGAGTASLNVEFFNKIGNSAKFAFMTEQAATTRT